MKLFDWIGFLCIVISLIILWQFREILLLLFMAIVVAIALNSLVRWFQRRFQIQRGMAMLSTLVVVGVGGSLVAALVLPPFIGQVLELGELIPKGIATVNTWQQDVRATDLDAQLPDWFPSLAEIGEQLQLPAVGDVVQQVGNIVQQVFGNFLSFFSSTAAIALQVLLVLVLTVMLLADPSAYRDLLLLLFPSFYRRRADEILTQCETILLAWLRGVMLSSIFVATACGLGLWLLQIDLAFAHALLAGLFNIIPNIGPTISVVFPIFVALIDINMPGKAIGVILLYVLVQNLESYWFSPMVMKHQVSMLPAATLLAQLFFASFFGPVGLILALPLAVVAKVWIQEALIHDVLDYWKKPPRNLHLDTPNVEALTDSPMVPAGVGTGLWQDEIEGTTEAETMKPDKTEVDKTAEGKTGAIAPDVSNSNSDNPVDDPRSGPESSHDRPSSYDTPMAKD